MSQLLLYISLIITLPAATGAAHEYGVKGEIEDIVFELVRDEKSTSQILSQADSDLDSLANESGIVSVIKIKHGHSLYQSQQTLGLFQHGYRIRAPPLTS